MHFSHHPAIWNQYPELAVGVLFARGLHRDVAAEDAIAGHEAAASARLRTVESESELAEIQAWRRTFARMGLKPTQYRCASESLLRRLRKEGELPRIHPLVDLCNSFSVEYAIPVAALDLAHIRDWLQVRPASGSERYQGFGGEIENPEPGEVSFVDAAGNAHARRWTHRQSGLSAVRDATRDVLIVTEAVHEGGGEAVARLVAALAQDLQALWGVQARTQVLTAVRPSFEFDPAAG